MLLTPTRDRVLSLGEATKQFRRVNGHLHLPALRAALDAHAWKTVTPQNYDEAAA